jgi:hypothetical protein
MSSAFYLAHFAETNVHNRHAHSCNFAINRLNFTCNFFDMAFLGKRELKKILPDCIEG